MAFIRNPEEKQTAETNTAPTLGGGGGASTAGDTGMPTASPNNRVAQSTTGAAYTPLKTAMPTIIDNNKPAPPPKIISGPGNPVIPKEIWNPPKSVQPAPSPIAPPTTGDPWTPIPKLPMPAPAPAPVAPTTPGMIDPWTDPYAEYQRKQKEWTAANPGAREDPTKITEYYDPNSGRWIKGDQGLSQRQAEWGQRYEEARKTWGRPVLTPEQQNQQYYNWDIGRQGPLNTADYRAAPAGYADWLKQLLTQDNQYSRAYKDAQKKGQEQMDLLNKQMRPGGVQVPNYTPAAPLPINNIW